MTIYECPECETRYLDERRCPDCSLFCRRIGTGGPRPHCDEPVALTELTPQGGDHADHLTAHLWWPPLGRSHGHQRADLMTVSEQFSLAPDTHRPLAGRRLPCPARCDVLISLFQACSVFRA